VAHAGTGPLLTLAVHEELLAARTSGAASLECSLDLARTRTRVQPGPSHWIWDGQPYPYLGECRARTIYYWTGAAFEPVSRYSGSLIKLIPTDWGPPTFEIDGIKMLPTAKISPFEDARVKVALVEPEGKIILDTCGGLGYFAACCLAGNAREVISCEKNADVLWLRSLNPWSPQSAQRLQVKRVDVSSEIRRMRDASVAAILHDPPRFGIAGELYSAEFYGQLLRVLKPRGRLFHYTGRPNMLTSGRNVPREVCARLGSVGFRTEIRGDGVLASRR
jgi:uncharacterized protein